MRADRLLSILLLLQVHRRMTAGELARRLEVSARTIHRDMEALGTAGVPVYAERGTGGGWSLIESYRTNLTGLNDAEIQALFLTRPPRILADLGLDRAAEAALIKLLAALPSVSRRGAEEVRQRILVETAGWRQADEATPCLRTVQEAVWQDRRLRFTYARAEMPVEREADPLGLVAKGSAWYLVAAVEGEPRTYRISRMLNAALLDAPAVRPPDFDLSEYWERSSRQFQANLPRYAFTIRVAREAHEHLGEPGMHLRVLREEPPDAAGWATLVLEVETERQAAALALAFGGQIAVLAPEGLRTLTAQLAAEVVAQYATSAAGLTTPTSSA
ncbi:MAG TPA: WYL domain-containing protein [Ktedonobacterales bacterium]|nr:WYL domain-containing protein [Ktedonobacterales bacterium]